MPIIKEASIPVDEDSLLVRYFASLYGLSVASFEGAVPEIKFSRAKGRYVRLCLSGTENGQPFELSEWEVYGKGGTKAVPKVAPVRKGARQLLSGGAWKLQRAPQVASSGEEISSAGFDDAGWLVATVPGTVLTTYVPGRCIPSSRPARGTRPRA